MNLFGRGQRYVVIVVMIIVIMGTRTIICDNLASFNTAVGDLLHKEDYLPHQPLTHYLTIPIIIIKIIIINLLPIILQSQSSSSAVS